MELFFDLFGPADIACLLGDREFVGKDWFRFLRRYKRQFQMRLKKNTRVRNGRGQFVPAWRLFAQSGVNRMLVIPQARHMWGVELFLSGCYLGAGEYLIQVAPGYTPTPQAEYKKRWGIETLFGALKSRGFNLEDTRLRDPERLSKSTGATGAGLHLGVRRWCMASCRQRPQVKEARLSAQEYLPARTQ